ncbi:cytochrome P450 [Rhizoctonia solani]|uniref:Cytochrome P450 n=1 Tax=Rhizoctonia solani TaxID=456999 RepID=A0A8H7I448_9AGAM|nr:cytochrome P450 [Rhizoctonia solani]
MSDMSPFIVAATLAALALLIHFVHSSSIWGDIPSITKAIKDNKKTFSDYVADVVAEHGPILQILIGRHPIVVISDRKEMERILLGGKCTDQSKRANEIFATITSIDKKVILLDETWKRHRRLTGPSMSRRYLERMSGRIASAANDLARLWDAKIRVVGSAAFDADSDLQLATMDAIVNITMGSPLGCVETAYNALSAEVIQSNGIVHLPQFDLPPLHEALRAMMESIERASGKQYKLLNSFLSNAISHSREREAILGSKGEGLATDADCVLDMIIQREAREGAEAFGKGEMLDELMTYVLAGQDTTAASLGWLVKFLPQDPEIQLRLHNEVCNVFGPGTESDEFLDFNLLDDHIRVPILEAVVAETLRCASVAAIISRDRER